MLLAEAFCLKMGFIVLKLMQAWLFLSSGRLFFPSTLLHPFYFVLERLKVDSYFIQKYHDKHLISLQAIKMSFLFYWTEKPKLLIPWMVLSLISILWCLIEMILLFAIWGEKDPHTGAIVYNWGKFGSYLVSVFLTIYFEIVVLSLYNKLNVYEPTPVNMAQIT